MERKNTMERLICLIKAERKSLILLVVLILALSGFFTWLLFPRNGLDARMNYGLGLFADVSDGYSRVQSENTTYKSDDMICLTITTAYFNDLSDAELAQQIRFLAVENPVFDISFDIGEEHNIGAIQDDIIYEDHYQEKCYVLELPDDRIDIKDLTFGKNIFGDTNHRDMNFTFRVYLKVKEDAPEDWSGNICIRSEVSGSEDPYGNSVYEGICVDYITYKKNGDQIILDAYERYK